MHPLRIFFFFFFFLQNGITICKVQKSLKDVKQTLTIQSAFLFTEMVKFTVVITEITKYSNIKDTS